MISIPFRTIQQIDAALNSPHMKVLDKALQTPHMKQMRRALDEARKNMQPILDIVERNLAPFNGLSNKVEIGHYDDL
jgi:hypothetical protein